MTKIDEEIDMDLWMEMTEAEQEAILAHEIRRYCEWWDRLTKLEQYKISRRRDLDLCLSWRRHLAGPFPMDIFREFLRESQKRLLALRIERATGVYPGSA